jgi:plastocyanin
MAFLRRLGIGIVFAAVPILDPIARAATRNVDVGPNFTHTFVDAQSGNSTSTIFVGDTIQWNWQTATHSTTSGSCPGGVCSPDGLWDSGINSSPHMFSRLFDTAGTFTYYCRVHLSFMQGTVIVQNPGPAPTVTAISPTSGSGSSLNPVSITGTNFVVGATVTIGGVAATGVVFVSGTSLTAVTPLLPAGALDDVTVTNPDTQSGTLAAGWLSDFSDVPQGDQFHDFVEKLIRNGVTAGCGGGMYCRDNSVRRDQMAVFLLKAKLGSSHVPPSCTGVFPDVPCPGQFTDWIEELASLNITAGCGGGNYCPGDPVTRQQMAVFLLKTEHGSGYVPPACAGLFDDVPCPSQFADWIERLAAENVTGGCSTSPPLYCPTTPNTRGQMAVFLVKTFNLP